MGSITMLIMIAIVAWIGQIVLTFFQIRAFNRMLQELAKKGEVKIGRTSSRWKARTIVVLVEDKEGVIVDAKVFKGMTVFARPQKLSCLVGGKFPFQSHIIQQLDKGVQEALTVAFS